MKIILEIINIIVKQMIVVEKKIFILDGYSYEYDRQNILSEIKKLVYERKNIFLEIIYDINNLRDVEILYQNLNPQNHINSKTKRPEKYYYIEKVRKFSDIEKYFAKNEIPENYNKIFGDNISYFFEYKKNKNITFDDFVKKKRNEIKKEMIIFSTFQLKNVLEYIEEKTMFGYYDDIFKYIPANYIDIILIPDPYDPKKETARLLYPQNYIYYSLNYSFPLIKEILQEILSNQGCFDIKNPSFLFSSERVLEINLSYILDKIIQRYFDDEYFFEYNNKNKIIVDDIIDEEEKKNYKLNKMKYFDNKKLFDKINFNEFECIGIFQRENCEKDFDFLFFLKKNIYHYYNMILIKVKCSDSYIENKEDLLNKIFYIKEKFSYLLNIEINKIYYTYLSVFQKPKKFANANKDKTFLFDLITEKFINFEDYEYNKFPLLKDSIIYETEESKILNQIIININNFENKKNIKLIKKEKMNFRLNTDKYDNYDQIKSHLNNNEIYVYVSPYIFKYCYNIDNNFSYSFIKNNGIYKDNYENLFEVKF